MPWPLAGAAAGLELVDVIHRESERSRRRRRPPLAQADRRRIGCDTRSARSPLRLGPMAGHLTYPELAEAIERAVAGLLRDRGEPAGLTRVAAAIMAELGSSGLLRRVADRARGDGRRRGRRRPDRGRAARSPRQSHPRGAVARRSPDPRPHRRRGAAAVVAARARAGRAAACRPRRVGDLVDPVDRGTHRRGRLLRAHLCGSFPDSRHPTRSWCAPAWPHTQAPGERGSLRDRGRPRAPHRRPRSGPRHAGRRTAIGSGCAPGSPAREHDRVRRWPAARRAARDEESVASTCRS